MSTDLITRIRRLVSEGGMSRSGLARAAGLHANTLRDLMDEAWNPTAETLGKLERFIFANDEGPALVPIEEIIDEARNGRMFILVDDEDRENEGDLVIPAQMATPDAINFMATHGRGLICLALTKQRADYLGLELMSRNNGSRHETAFTVSIEAREGVTTGISAADRARTVSVAIDGSKGPSDLVAPGQGRTVLHVYQGPFESKLILHGTPASGIRSYRAAFRREAEKRMTARLAELAAPNVRLVLRHGSPPRVLQKTDRDALLVLDRGRSFIRRALLGSVTRAVIAHGTSDVLLV